MANGLDLSFTTVDYAVFGIMLVISFGIGVYHAFMSSTTKEGLLNQQRIILLRSSYPPIQILLYKPWRVASKHNISKNHQNTIAWHINI